VTRLALALLPLLALAGPARAAEPTLAQGKAHWAFRPVRRPVPPSVRDASWARNPVDLFVLAKLEAAGLRPGPPADRRTLLRRVSLDLTGLPPTPEEQEAFLADTRPDAYERLVDRLLASPAYGERWGRHWLDVARYADTNGYERDGDKPFAWRYRDWVIGALNRDLPFDRFVTEQLAGDELPDADAASHTATTFMRLGTWDDEPANDRIDRFDQLDDVLGTASSAFLGLTLRCARCHDHKFEPFTARDYYRLLAVFTPLVRPQRGRADLDWPVGTAAELAVYHKAKSRHDADMAALRQLREAALAPARGRVLRGDAGTLPADARAALAVEPRRRSPPQRDLARRYQKQFDAELSRAPTPEERSRLTQIDRALAERERARPAELPRAYVWTEAGPKAPETRLFRRGNPNLVGAAVEPGLPPALVGRQPPPPSPLAHSTGRRLWLANWVASADNPLTARVIVNRAWQHHFGKGLVATPNDFGLAGARPSHPELLDWLAAAFVAEGWSLKNLHRLLVLSATYQTSSAAEPGDDRPERKLALFGRYRQRRLEAEAVRDAALATSGQLNREQGGPGVYPTLPPAVLAGQSRPGQGWGKSDERQASRRSVYVFAKRSLAVPELELLDSPDTTSSCEQRPVSTTGPQALTFLNGAFFNEQARHLADRLLREAGPLPAEQARRAYALALGRPPSAREERLVVAFLARQERQIAADAGGKLPPAEARRRALAAFCLVLLNTNEFVYPG
jgi:hypothetical protein